MRNKILRKHHKHQYPITRTISSIIRLPRSMSLVLPSTRQIPQAFSQKSLTPDRISPSDRHPSNEANEVPRHQNNTGNEAICIGLITQ
jgi:hypothetical protein